MSKNKKIKKLEKSLRNREKMVRYWMGSYWDVRNDMAVLFNEQDTTIKVIAKILKEMQG